MPRLRKGIIQMVKKKKTYEEAALRLEEIVDKLENSDVSLEEAIGLYKEGMELTLICREKLDCAQKEVMELKKNFDGSFSLKPFNTYNENGEGEE